MVVGDDDPGKRWVYLYLLAETCNPLPKSADTCSGHRLQELPVTDDLSCVAN